MQPKQHAEFERDFSEDIWYYRFAYHLFALYHHRYDLTLVQHTTGRGNGVKGDLTFNEIAGVLAVNQIRPKYNNVTGRRCWCCETTSFGSTVVEWITSGVILEDRDERDWQTMAAQELIANIKDRYALQIKPEMAEITPEEIATLIAQYQPHEQ
jgi:hypothetical protein